MKSVLKTTVFETNKACDKKMIKVVQRFLIITAVVLSTTILTLAKEWRGITPLVSTRADVLKILGEPKPPNDQFLGERFTVDGEIVYIAWTRADCRDEENMIAGTPPPALNVVVQQITVDRKSKLTLEDVRKMDPPKKVLTSEGLIPKGFSAIVYHHCYGWGGACTVMNPSGFGYSTNTERQVTRLYYLTSSEEFASWSEKTTPCQSEKK
jgi:hypothetical protein